MGKSHMSASDRVADLADSLHLPRRHHHEEIYEVRGSGCKILADDGSDRSSNTAEQT
jgi:hypothetical protein